MRFTKEIRDVEEIPASQLNEQEKKIHEILFNCDEEYKQHIEVRKILIDSAEPLAVYNIYFNRYFRFGIVYNTRNKTWAVNGWGCFEKSLEDALLPFFLDIVLAKI